jgi:hypothetical protein
MFHCLCLSVTSLTFVAALTEPTNAVDRDPARLDGWGNRAGWTDAGLLRSTPEQANM